MEIFTTLATMLLLASLAMVVGHDAKGKLTSDMVVWSGVPCDTATGWQ